MLMGEVLRLGNIIFQTPILFAGPLFLKIEWWLQNVALDEGGGFGIINGGNLMKLLFKFGIPLVMIGLAIFSYAESWGRIGNFFK